MPLRRKLTACEDLLDDATSGCWAHGELASNEVAEVVDDGVAEVLGALVKDIVECADTLTIEAKVLRETLRNAHFHLRFLVEDVTHGPSVLVYGPGCEALVGRVEEGENSFALTEVDNGFPLFLVGV